MALLISLVLFFATILPISSIFNIKKKISIILAYYLTGYALIVLTAEISGIAGLLSREWFFLLIQTVEGLVVWGIWIKKGKPDLFIHLVKGHVGGWGKYLVDFIKRNPFTSLLGMLVAGGYGVLAWLIIRVPPNNTDSMKTHLARVVYWLQQSSFKQLTCYSIFAKTYPFDAQLNILWSVLFTQSDKFVGFIQYFAAIFCAVAIFGIARLLNGSRRSALLISLFWLTYPIVVYQATSTQVDLVATAIFTTSIYFLFDYYKNRNDHSIFFSALAMGLALGTKGTVFMMGLGVLMVTVLFIIKDRKAISWLSRWSVLVIISFLIVGSFTYFNNIYYYHNPFGPHESMTSGSFGAYSFGEKLKYNAPRLLYQFISFDSLPTKIANQATDFKSGLFKKFDGFAGLNLESLNAITDHEARFTYDISPKYNEDASWFGFGSVLIIIPAFFIGIFTGIKRRDVLSISLVIFSISFILSEMLLRPGWDPYQGRYFMFFVAIISPLAINFTHEKAASKFYTFFTSIVILVTFFMAVFSNESKPILGQRIFEYKYVDMEKNFIPTGIITGNYRTYSLRVYDFLWENLPFYYPLDFYDDTQLRTFSNRSRHENIVNLINDNVLADARMGVILDTGEFDYVFFGNNLTRILINIDPDKQLFDRQWIENQNLSFVLIGNYNRFDILPDYFRLMTEVDGWGLFEVNFQN